MNVVIDIGHPAHVHLFRNYIREMEGLGHSVLVTTIEKDVTTHLLKEAGIPYVVLGSEQTSRLRKILQTPVLTWRMHRALRAFRPDVVLGVATIRGAHVAWLTRKPCYVLDDTEPGWQERRLYLPFAARVWTPESYRGELGPKQVRYPGYHELAYLHPSRFRPDCSVLKELGVSPGEPYFVLRWVSWKAVHDIGRHGFSPDERRQMVEELRRHGKVFISSEGEPDPALRPYEYRGPKHRLLDAIAFAKMVVTESQTVAAEAALLGVPALRYNSFVTDKDMGNFLELERRYGLLFSFSQTAPLYDKMRSLLRNPALEEEWREKRDRMLKDKIDVTDWMVRETLKNPAARGNSK